MLSFSLSLPLSFPPLKHPSKLIIQGSSWWWSSFFHGLFPSGWFLLSPLLHCLPLHLHGGKLPLKDLIEAQRSSLHRSPTSKFPLPRLQKQLYLAIWCGNEGGFGAWRHTTMVVKKMKKKRGGIMRGLCWKFLEKEREDLAFKKLVFLFFFVFFSKAIPHILFNWSKKGPPLPFIWPHTQP